MLFVVYVLRKQQQAHIPTKGLLKDGFMRLFTSRACGISMHQLQGGCRKYCIILFFINLFISLSFRVGNRAIQYHLFPYLGFLI